MDWTWNRYEPFELWPERWPWTITSTSAISVALDAGTDTNGIQPWEHLPMMHKSKKHMMAATEHKQPVKAPAKKKGKGKGK